LAPVLLVLLGFFVSSGICSIAIISILVFFKHHCEIVFLN
jgi:hypothetical protein